MLIFGASEDEPGLLAIQGDSPSSLWVILNGGLDMCSSKLDCTGPNFAEDLDDLPTFCRAAFQRFPKLRQKLSQVSKNVHKLLCG